MSSVWWRPASHLTSVIAALQLVCAAASAEPRVALGGTGGLPSLIDPKASQAFRSLPSTGFYLHYSATDPIFAPTLHAIAKIFAGKPTVAEVSLGGGFAAQFWSTDWHTHVLAYGFSPKAVVVNVDMATVDKSAAAPAEELKDFRAFLAAGRSHGAVTTFAPVTSPNSSGGAGPEGDAKTLAIAHPWSDPWWDRFREMALAGGGIAFDAPPAFFLHGLPDSKQNLAYQAFTIAGLRWANEHHLWSVVIASPYFDANIFQTNSETERRILAVANALPETWVIENYSECGPPYNRSCIASDAAAGALVGAEIERNTESSVALWFARGASR